MKAKQCYLTKNIITLKDHLRTANTLEEFNNMLLEYKQSDDTDKQSLGTKYLNRNRKPITHTFYNGIYRELKFEYILRTVMDENFRILFGKHDRNLAYKVYEQLSKQRTPFKVGDKPTRHQIRRRFKTVINRCYYFIDDEHAINNTFIMKKGVIISMQLMQEHYFKPLN